MEVSFKILFICISMQRPHVEIVKIVKNSLGSIGKGVILKLVKELVTSPILNRNDFK